MGKTYAILNATILDGTAEMKAMANHGVIVGSEGRIEEVGPSERLRVEKGMNVIDLGGRVLMPGLTNMHVHLCGNGRPTSAKAAGDLIDKVVSNPVGMAYLRHRIKKSAINQLMSGVTTLRSVGDPGFADVDVRDAINAGKYLGPRMLTSGTGVTVPGGHGAGLFARIAETPADARQIVQACHDRRCDLIKLFITGGVFDAEVEGEPGVVRMSLDIARAACEEAHRLGMHTAAHIESTDGGLLGLKAGVDTIEHGAHLTSEVIKLFKKNGLGNSSSLTCTISPAIPFAKLPPEKTHSTAVQKVNGDIVYKGIVEAASQALKAGIPVGLGTDSSCPYVTHYDMWREVAYFQKHVGTSNEFALHTATLAGAQLLGIGEETGSIEPGKSADMIVLEGDPLKDISALRNVSEVFMRGARIERPRIRHIAALDRELDALMESLEG